MSIDLVVVNYKTEGDLNEFLQSLERHPPRVNASLTVIDVDTQPYERQFTCAGMPARTIGVAGNIGYARACNYAASRGTRDQIALFNADIVLSRGAIDTCHDALARNDWGILGPCQVDYGNRIRHAGIFGSLEAPVHRGWNEVNRGQYADVRDAVTISGSAYFIKRDVWTQLAECPTYRQVATDAQGAFLPTAHYYEETWCSYHAHAHGHRVIYYGYVTVVHGWHRASPVGGWAEQQMPVSRELFREACRAHGIPHD